MTLTDTIDARRRSLDTTCGYLDMALQQERIPWTAVAQLARLRASLVAEIADLELSATREQHAEDQVSAEHLHRAILALPDELVDVARRALDERARR